MKAPMKLIAITKRMRSIRYEHSRIASPLKHIRHNCVLIRQRRPVELSKGIATGHSVTAIFNGGKGSCVVSVKLIRLVSELIYVGGMHPVITIGTQMVAPQSIADYQYSIHSIRLLIESTVTLVVTRYG